MTERKETITLTNGEEAHVHIGYLGFRKKNQIFTECLKFGAKGKEVDMNDVRIFELKTKVLEATVTGLKDFDLLKEEDGEMIFDKYFGTLLSDLGGSKN